MCNMIINEVFIEIRYPDSLMFNDMPVLQSICNSLINILPNRNYDKGNNLLNLTSNDTKFRVTIGNNRTIIDYTQPESYEDFKKVGNKVLGIIVDKLMINYVIRVGMRSLSGIEKLSEIDATKYICDNYVNKQKIESNTIGKIVGCGINMSFERDEYRVNLALIPNTFQTITVTPEGSSQTRRCEVQIDTDVYLNSMNDITKLCNDFIDDVININQNEINEFISKMSE